MNYFIEDKLEEMNRLLNAKNIDKRKLSRSRDSLMFNLHPLIMSQANLSHSLVDKLSKTLIETAKQIGGI